MVQRDAKQQRLGMSKRLPPTSVFTNAISPKKARSDCRLHTLPAEMLITLYTHVAVGINEAELVARMFWLFGRHVFGSDSNELSDQTEYTKSVTHTYVMAATSYALELCCGFQLQHIDLTGCTNLTLHMDFLRDCHWLKYANFTGCRALTGLNLLGTCKLLETLILRNCGPLDDAYMSTFLHLLNLHILDISGTKMVDNMYMNCLEKCKNIRTLDVSNSPGIHECIYDWIANLESPTCMTSITLDANGNNPPGISTSGALTINRIGTDDDAHGPSAESALAGEKFGYIR